MMNPVLFYIAGIPVYSYTVVLDLAIIAGVAAAMMAGRQRGWKAGTVMEAALPVLAAALVGARLAYVVTHWAAYAERPVALLYIWEGGLDLGGGIAAGAAMVLLIARRADAPGLIALDVAAVGVLIAVPLGRLGCIPGGCAYGIVLPASAWGWPLPDADGVVLPRFPSQVVEAAAEGVLAGALWLLARRSSWPVGGTVASALAGYGVIHLAAAGWRGDMPALGPVPLGAVWAALALAAGVGITVAARRRLTRLASLPSPSASGGPALASRRDQTSSDTRGPGGEAWRKERPAQ